MGIWAGIKYALNSTLGTSKFQSLDKMILGAKGLVESGNLYLNTGISKSFEEALDSYESVQVKVDEIIEIKWGGSIRLNFVATTNQGLSNRVRVFIKKNDEAVYVSDYFGSTTVSPLSVSETLTVKPDDRIVIGFYFTTSSVAGPIVFRSAITDVKIYADLIDASGISIK